MREVGDAHEEADGVEDVAFAGSVEPSDGVEGRVPSVDLRPVPVRLEAVDHHRLDVHLDSLGSPTDRETVNQVKPVNYKS